MSRLVLAAFAMVGATCVSACGDPPPPPVPAGAIYVTVGGRTISRPISGGFVGFSFEYYAVETQVGRDPRTVNPVLVQLMRNLAPGSTPVLRIGGDSTDWTWYPVRGMRAPPGVRFAITKQWLHVVRGLADATGARVIPGINLEADSEAVASAEAASLMRGIGRDHIRAFELGNEPELYAVLGWYRGPSRPVPGRQPGYDMRRYARDFSRLAAGIPPVPLAGPATGAPDWMSNLRVFLGSASHLGLVTVHRYPEANCPTPTTSPAYPSLSHLLSSYASAGLAASVARDVAITHAHGLPLRVDELNSVACGGKPGLSDTYAAALWALAALPQLAQVGVDGVNFHTFPRGIYRLFNSWQVHGSWRGAVRPVYYGALMFSQAAPPGSRMLRMSWSTRRSIQAWATRGRQGQTRVVLINDAQHGSKVLAVRIPGASHPATIERLRAPGIFAKHGISLGGQTFGNATSTGLLAGHSKIATIPVSAGHTYVVRLPAASAALLMPGV
jgi:hypothetical protein